MSAFTCGFLSEFPFLGQEERERLIFYCKLLKEASYSINLLSKKAAEGEIGFHVEDCVRGAIILNTVGYQKGVDVGSGGGLPGIVIGILYPQADIVLVDSCRKKCSFLRFAAESLGLKNIKVENKRVESFKGGGGVLTSRAAFSPDNIPLLFPLMVEAKSSAFWVTPTLSKALKDRIRKTHNAFFDEYFYHVQGKERGMLLVDLRRNG